jgi:branched-chain amino acid aminotransferase
VSLDIAITRTTSPRPRPPQGAELGFGKYFSDHFFAMDYTVEQGWFDARIVPYGPIPMDPAAGVFHYGQAMFEGLKAFKRLDGSLALFRPEMHARRLEHGADRLCLPPVPAAHTLDAAKALIRVDADWVPGKEGTAMYLRPTVIATEGFLGVRPATRYLFFIIASPVGSYYAGGLKPVRIWVEADHVRAPRGGLGAVKAGANYAASLFAAQRAKKDGYDQVLWLDGKDHAFVEEVGTMNLCVIIGNSLVTPPLSDSILAGVTRDSVLVLAREMGLTVEERPLPMKELISAHTAGTLKEVFGTGTAAVISSVGELATAKEKLVINGGKVGPISQKLYEEISSIQRGARPDTHQWMMVV